MTKAEMRARIAFGLTVLVIGYNFLPVQAPDSVRWIASITCFIIGFVIFFKVV